MSHLFHFLTQPTLLEGLQLILLLLYPNDKDDHVCIQRRSDRVIKVTNENQKC